MNATANHVPRPAGSPPPTPLPADTDRGNGVLNYTTVALIGFVAGSIVGCLFGTGWAQSPAADDPSPHPRRLEHEP